MIIFWGFFKFIGIILLIILFLILDSKLDNEIEEDEGLY